MTETKTIRKPNGQRVMVEINPRTGDPQAFPFTEADSNAIRLANENPQNAALQELAQSVRDHREGFRQGHTLDCPGNLARGLCH